jgi:hypothetical protein
MWTIISKGRELIEEGLGHGCDETQEETRGEVSSTRSLSLVQDAGPSREPRSTDRLTHLNLLVQCARVVGGRAAKVVSLGRLRQTRSEGGRLELTPSSFSCLLTTIHSSTSKAQRRIGSPMCIIFASAFFSSEPVVMFDVSADLPDDLVWQANVHDRKA